MGIVTKGNKYCIRTVDGVSTLGLNSNIFSNEKVLTYGSLERAIDVAKREGIDLFSLRYSKNLPNKDYKKAVELVKKAESSNFLEIDAKVNYYITPISKANEESRYDGYFIKFEEGKGCFVECDEDEKHFDIQIGWIKGSPSLIDTDFSMEEKMQIVDACENGIRKYLFAKTNTDMRDLFVEKGVKDYKKKILNKIEEELVSGMDSMR